MAYHLQRLCTPEAFQAAWRRVRAKNRSGGTDGVSVESFDRHADRLLVALRTEVLDGRYVPAPLKRIQIPKDTPGDTRTLHLPAVRDKVVQEVVRAGIDSRLDRMFLDCSYGYRLGKGAQRAVRRVTHEIVSRKRTWAAIADIDDFFSSLDQGLLIDTLRARLPDEDLLRLVGLWLRMGTVDGKGRWRDVRSGVAQGGVISPLLANLYLHEFDVHMIGRGHALVRYADDFVVLAQDRGAAERGLTEAQEFLKARLRLRLNRNPAPVRSPVDGFTFLGIRFAAGRRELDEMRSRSIDSRLQDLSVRHVPPDPERALAEFNRAVVGWRSYYGALLSGDALAALDVRVNGALQSLLAALAAPERGCRAGTLDEFLKHVELLIVRTGESRRDLLAGLLRSSREGARAAARQPPVGGGPGKNGRPVPGEKMRSVEQTVRAAKRRHTIARAVASDLVVTTPGSFIGKAGQRVAIRHNRRIVLEVPVMHLTSITVATHGVSLSTDIVDLCTQRGIPLLLVDGIDRVRGTLVSPTPLNVRVALAQLATRADGPKTITLARTFAIAKIRNQLTLLKYLGKYRRKADPTFTSTLDTNKREIAALLQELARVSVADPDTGRSRIFGIEGRAAQWYWDMFGLAIGRRQSFPGRVGHGARDLVNMLLNYAYALLQSRVHLAILRAGLSPEIGFLHAAAPGRAALVFDLMEEFRAPAVDRTVLTLIGRGQPARIGADGLLDARTRGLLTAAFRGRLGSLQRHLGRELTFDEIIGAQARLLAQSMETGVPYAPYLSTW